jgi:hydrogenase maturation protein HypF
MIPYTPLHHLLMAEVATPLIMTSGNLSEEPIVMGIVEARDRLGSLADGFLLHDREIVARCDDSVLQVVNGSPLFHRRARGFAPLPVPLPFPSSRPLLAVGPHLKNTFALAHKEEVYVSQHIGDLETVETLDHFKETVGRFQRLFRIDPEVVVRDLHPGYLSTRLAHELASALGSVEVLAVQHHHAHVAAVLAEHGETRPAVGLAFDGTGYGEDGCVWGAEILVADLESYRRVGRLRYAPLPGGEAAVRNPWRTVLGYLSLEPEHQADFRLAFSGVPRRNREIVTRQAEKGINSPLASSMGRLFDAAAAVLGLRNRCAYEGQAAMELEAVAGGLGGVRAAAREAGTGRMAGMHFVGGQRQGADGPAEPDPHGLPFPAERDASGVYLMDPLPLLSALGGARRRGSSVGELARGFHAAVARTSAGLAARVCEEEGISVVVLSGGVFQNALLLQTVRGMLEERGLRVLIPRALSPNDGAISFGQAAVAAARLRSREGRKGSGTAMQTARHLKSLQPVEREG